MIKFSSSRSAGSDRFIQSEEGDTEIVIPYATTAWLAEITDDLNLTATVSIGTTEGGVDVVDSAVLVNGRNAFLICVPVTEATTLFITSDSGSTVVKIRF